MARPLSFVYRTDEAATRRIFQEGRTGFLLLGQVTIQDGYAVDENGVRTTYGMLRTLAFFHPETPKRTGIINPGDLGINPLNFRLGRVTVRGPSRTTVLTTSSKTILFTEGRLTLVTTSALGALTDFAIFGAGQEDPRDFYVETATDLNSGGVTQAAARHSAVFVPHRDARYLAIGARVYDVPSSGSWRNQYFKKFMVEKVDVARTTPSPKYSKAREVQVRVKPDRMNWHTNPSADVDTTGFTPGGAAVPTLATDTARAWAVPRSFRLTSTVAGTDMNMAWSTGVPLPVGVYTTSHYVWSNGVARDHWVSITQDGVAVQGEKQRILAQVWGRVEQTFEVTTAQVVTFTYNAQSLVSRPIGSQVWFDGFLLEEGDEAGAWFDGSTSGDTMWERGGTVGLTRSYLYKNRADRYAAIVRVLQDNVPLGIGRAEPLMGVLPVELRVG